MRPQAVVLRLIETSLPALHSRLLSEGVPVKEQTTHWLLCAFVDALPLDCALRLWDLLFLDGEGVLHRAVPALLALRQAELMAAPELSSLKPVLQCGEPGVLVAELLRQRGA